MEATFCESDQFHHDDIDWNYHAYFSKSSFFKEELECLQDDVLSSFDFQSSQTSTVNSNVNIPGGNPCSAVYSHNNSLDYISDVLDDTSSGPVEALVALLYNGGRDFKNGSYPLQCIQLSPEKIDDFIEMYSKHLPFNDLQNSLNVFDEAAHNSQNSNEVLNHSSLPMGLQSLTQKLDPTQLNESGFSKWNQACSSLSASNNESKTLHLAEDDASKHFRTSELSLNDSNIIQNASSSIANGSINISNESLPPFAPLSHIVEGLSERTRRETIPANGDPSEGNQEVVILDSSSYNCKELVNGNPLSQNHSPTISSHDESAIQSTSSAKSSKTSPQHLSNKQEISSDTKDNLLRKTSSKLHKRRNKSFLETFNARAGSARKPACNSNPAGSVNSKKKPVYVISYPSSSASDCDTIMTVKDSVQLIEIRPKNFASISDSAKSIGSQTAISQNANSDEECSIIDEIPKASKFNNSQLQNIAPKVPISQVYSSVIKGNLKSNVKSGITKFQHILPKISMEDGLVQSSNKYSLKKSTFNSLTVDPNVHSLQNGNVQNQMKALKVVQLDSLQSPSIGVNPHQISSSNTVKDTSSFSNISGLTQSCVNILPKPNPSNYNIVPDTKQPNVMYSLPTSLPIPKELTHLTPNSLVAYQVMDCTTNSNVGVLVPVSALEKMDRPLAIPCSSNEQDAYIVIEPPKETKTQT